MFKLIIKEDSASGQIVFCINQLRKNTGVLGNWILNHEIMTGTWRATSCSSSSMSEDMSRKIACLLNQYSYQQILGLIIHPIDLTADLNELIDKLSSSVFQDSNAQPFNNVQTLQSRLI